MRMVLDKMHKRLETYFPTVFVMPLKFSLLYTTFIKQIQTVLYIVYIWFF